MNKIKLISFLLIGTLGAAGQVNFPNSYYITLNDDTVKTTIVYSDIINTQHILQVIEEDGSPNKFFPDEIKGFCINTDSSASFVYKFLFFEYEYDEIQKVMAQGMSGLIQRPAYEFSNLVFKSIEVPGRRKKIFMHAKYGKDGPIQFLTYYYVFQTKYSLQLFTINLILKDNVLLRIKGRKAHKWLSRAVSDYPMLSKMVLEKKLNMNNPKMKRQFPDVELILNEYRDWKKRSDESKKDTSLALKGIMDADRLYNPHPTYIKTLIPSGFFVLPGLIYAQFFLNKEPTVKELNLPVGCKYCTDNKYMYGYRMRVMYKKSRAMARGVLTGGVITYFVILPLLIITS